MAGFILRGIAIQGIYPPLEGPDEYQHIAYLQHLLEHRSMPVYGRAQVPESLYGDMVANPHSRYDWEQTGVIGCLAYDRFYDVAPRLSGKPMVVGLYQAQHPPLYYVLAAPVYAAAKAWLGFRPAVYLLRVINIAIAAAALVLLLAPLRGFNLGDATRRLCALAVSLSPMYMIYVSRVSNDALALLFAGAALRVVMTLDRATRPAWAALLAGLLVGAGVVTKMTALVLLPASVAFLLYLALCRRLAWRRLLLLTVMLAAGYLTIALPYHAWCWRNVGTPLSAQETIINTAAGHSPLDVLGQARARHLKTFFFDMMVRGNLWSGGWSFLKPLRAFSFTYVIVLSAACAGVLAWLCRRWRAGTAFARGFPPHVMLCLLTVLAAGMAAYLHALNCLLAYGAIYTPPYYVMIAYPAFIACLAAAAAGYGRRAAALFALALCVLFVVTELHSLVWIAAPLWANAGDRATIVARLAAVHPAFPGPLHFPFFYGLAVLSAVAGALKGVSRRRPRPVPGSPPAAA